LPFLPLSHSHTQTYTYAKEKPIREPILDPNATHTYNTIIAAITGKQATSLQSNPVTMWTYGVQL